MSNRDSKRCFTIPFDTHALIGKSVLILVLVSSLAATAFAQQGDTAGLFGTVTDPTGSAIPSALVTLTQAATGQVRSVTSSQSGEYLFSLLPVGTYSLAVEKEGFQAYRQSGLLAQANDNIKVDVVLQVGSTKTTVSVSGAASQVETRSMTLKETVNSQSIQDLPLNGRNPGDLALVTPGVVSGRGGVSGSTGRGQPSREKRYSPLTARVRQIPGLRWTGESTPTICTAMECPFRFLMLCRSSRWRAAT